MEQLRRDKVAMTCVGIIAFFYLVAIFAPWLCDLLGVQVNPESSLEATNLTDYVGMPVVGPPNHGFTWEHPLGIAPQLATDNLASWIYGARTSLTVATVSAAAATLIGIVMGLLAGFRSEEHTSELQSRGHLVCRLLLENKNNTTPVHRRRA